MKLCRVRACTHHYRVAACSHAAIKCRFPLGVAVTSSPLPLGGGWHEVPGEGFALAHPKIKTRFRTTFSQQESVLHDWILGVGYWIFAVFSLLFTPQKSVTFSLSKNPQKNPVKLALVFSPNLFPRPHLPHSKNVTLALITSPAPKKIPQYPCGFFCLVTRGHPFQNSGFFLQKVTIPLLFQRQIVFFVRVTIHPHPRF